MIPDLVTDLIAGYGALVASIVAVVQIRNLRPHVVVTVERVWLSDSDNRLSDEEICVQAANHGSRSVYFKAFPALFFGKAGMVMPNPHFGDDTFPLELKPGASCKVYMNPPTVAEWLKKSGAHGVVGLRGRYTDETKRVYWSHRFGFNIDNPLQTQD